MPNWVTTVIRAKNPQVLLDKLTRPMTQEEIEECKKYHEEIHERIVDFNLLIPCSKDLDIVSGSCSYLDESNKYNISSKANQINLQKVNITPLLQQYYNENQTQEEFINNTLNKVLPQHLQDFITVYNLHVAVGEEKLIKEIRNILAGFYNNQKYGEIDSYEFHTNKWGTKWNATTIQIDNDGLTWIDTAWSCPIPVLKELSKYTPITVAWADEDTGSNIGLVEFDNGKERIHLIDEGWEKIGGIDRLRNMIFALEIKSGDVVEDYFEMYSKEELQDMFKMSKKELDMNIPLLEKYVSNLLDKHIYKSAELPKQVTVTETDTDGNELKTTVLTPSADLQV